MNTCMVMKAALFKLFSGNTFTHTHIHKCMQMSGDGETSASAACAGAERSDQACLALPGSSVAV